MTTVVHTYADGNAAPPSGISKKDAISGFLLANFGRWVTTEQIAQHLEMQHGLRFNDFTRRLKDVREEEYLNGIMVDSQKLSTGVWEYKMDTMSQEYKEAYIKRSSTGKPDDNVIKELTTQIDLMKLALDAAPLPSDESDLSLGEWDHAYETWYITTRKLI